MRPPAKPVPFFPRTSHHGVVDYYKGDVFRVGLKFPHSTQHLVRPSLMLVSMRTPCSCSTLPGTGQVRRLGRPLSRLAEWIDGQCFFILRFLRSSSTQTSWWRRSTAGSQHRTAPRSLATNHWRRLFLSSYSTLGNKEVSNTEDLSGQT